MPVTRIIVYKQKNVNLSYPSPFDYSDLTLPKPFLNNITNVKAKFFMKKMLFGVLFSALIISCNNENTEEQPSENKSTEEVAKKPATEILDLSEADGVKAGFAALSKKDIPGFTADYDDNVKQLWSGGDSLIGKSAVVDYWNGRMNLIDSLNFSELILLPIRVNESQSPKYATPGKWVMAWNFSHVKYKNGKTLHFWVHTDFHYNDAGKINTIVQYIDRAPILEATKGMK